MPAEAGTSRASCSPLLAGSRKNTKRRSTGSRQRPAGGPTQIGKRWTDNPVIAEAAADVAQQKLLAAPFQRQVAMQTVRFQVEREARSAGNRIIWLFVFLPWPLLLLV